jgi:hypothetical protein
MKICENKITKTGGSSNTYPSTSTDLELNKQRIRLNLRATVDSSMIL